MTKDAEEAARDYCSKYPMWGNEHSENLFKAGWQAKESREAELMSLLERAHSMLSGDAHPYPDYGNFLEDFDKMKWKK